MYNHITLALKDSHPSDWMEDQVKVHEVFSNMLDLDPEEETIDDVIDELIEENPTISVDDVLEEIENERIL